MTNYYLAIDIGASSGRHILGWMQDGKMQTEEIYRFPNRLREEDGHLCWDVDTLFQEIKTGMRKCADMGKIPVSVGVDTWAVDFVLLDGNDNRIGPAVSYRDKRTEKMDEWVYTQIPEETLYAKTGIQKQIFNTIYQLAWIKKNRPEWMEQAECMLMIPDYFHYLLSGKKVQEYTNATTTQMVHAKAKRWDMDLIRILGYKESLFKELSMPGTVVGDLKENIAGEVGYTCKVILPASHDTASAVLAVPGNKKDFLYISSGTWSLMGTEREAPDCRQKSREANFTNEGGYEYRYRYLKNIMGLWMIQSVRRKWQAEGEDYSFSEICERASKESISSTVDCNASCFLAPDDMGEAVREFCRQTDQQVPKTKWELAAVIYNSLAECYKKCAQELEDLINKSYNCIQIVGGGANAEYLNRLTAQKTGKTVYAGPTEATAIGNLTAQMLCEKEFADVEAARECIYHSFEIKTYQI